MPRARTWPGIDIPCSGQFIQTERKNVYGGVLCATARPGAVGSVSGLAAASWAAGFRLL